MAYRPALILAALCFLCSGANAGFLSDVPSPTAYPYSNSEQHAKTTSIAFRPERMGLRKRETAKDRECGSEVGGDYYTCNNPIARCTNTLLSKGKTYRAYQYCSTPNLANQAIFTGAISSWNLPIEKCPESIVCCYGKSRLVRTIWYATSDYTVTGLQCTDSPPLTAVYVPEKNLLDPPKFKASLAALNKGSPLSLGAEVGIGVGIGVAAIIAFVLGMLFWMRRRRLRKSETESLSEQRTDAAELPGKGNPYELVSKYWDSPELPSHEDPKEMSIREPQELPGHWLPPEASTAQRNEESVRSNSD